MTLAACNALSMKFQRDVQLSTFNVYFGFLVN